MTWLTLFGRSTRQLIKNKKNLSNNLNLCTITTCRITATLSARMDMNIFFLLVFYQLNLGTIYHVFGYLF